MRPKGEITLALRAAAMQGPGTAVDLAHRAQVGMQAAHYTVSRMVDRGDLIVLQPGRPAVLALPPSGDALADSLDAIARCWWESPIG